MYQRINRQKQGDRRHYGKSVGTCTEADAFWKNDTICNGIADEYAAASVTYLGTALENALVIDLEEIKAEQKQRSL